MRMWNLMHLYVYRRWNGCFLGEYSGIVVCGENTEEETERTEPFCSATRLNTGGLHRITLLQTIHSGKKFSFRFYQAKVLVWDMNTTFQEIAWKAKDAWAGWASVDQPLLWSRLTPLYNLRKLVGKTTLIPWKIPIGKIAIVKKCMAFSWLFMQENCHMGQFLQDGENVCLMSFFLSKASVWPNLTR